MAKSTTRRRKPATKKPAAKPAAAKKTVTRATEAKNAKAEKPAEGETVAKTKPDMAAGVSNGSAGSVAGGSTASAKSGQSDRSSEMGKAPAGNAGLAEQSSGTVPVLTSEESAFLGAFEAQKAIGRELFDNRFITWDQAELLADMIRQARKKDASALLGSSAMAMHLKLKGKPLPAELTVPARHVLLRVFETSLAVLDVYYETINRKPVEPEKRPPVPIGETTLGLVDEPLALSELATGPKK